MNTLTTSQRLDGALPTELHTAREIQQQPHVWRELAQTLHGKHTAIDAWVGSCLEQAGHKVILTGAGSSAYVGEIVADTVQRLSQARVQAIPTTSLLSHPELYLKADEPTLLVSFARSGNSPESLAAVELVRSQVREARFLNITCNAQGSLARQSEGREDSVNLLMPPASCDQGFAMTSSFSSMLIAALVVLTRSPADATQARLQALADAAEQALPGWSAQAARLAEQDFDRIVYLASGPLESLAKEAALKVLELSCGKALAMANTPLGFRHGPKSALNARSLVVVLRSQQALARRYEDDLIQELRRDGVAGACVTVGSGDTGADLALEVPAPLQGLPDAWLAPLWLLLAQLFSLHKSIALGLTPDNPFPDGTVNRVVQGVTIYPA